MPGGSGVVFDVKVGQLVGPEMDEIEGDVFAYVDCHFGRLSSRQVL